MSPVSFDVAEAGGPEELDVPVGGDGDEDAFESEHLAAGPELVEAALDLLGGVAVLGLGAMVEGAEGFVHGGGAIEDVFGEKQPPGARAS